MPRFLELVEECETSPADSSSMVLDNRDRRLVSPFQNWLLEEIMTNSASSINVLTERDQVMPPSSGFHLSFFGNYTLDGIKVVFCFALATSTGGPCGAWDAPTALALAHPYFQPFTWPLMRDTSASYVDLKFYNGNELLGHWIFRGYRSDTDLTVQQAMVDEVLIRTAHQGRFRPSVVISVFIGWRVSVLSFEVGGRSY